MRSILRLALFCVAATCWLAAGPGGETTRALLACSHETMHHAKGHHSAPADGPCFCDQMTGGFDLVVSTAAPTPPATQLAVTAPITHVVLTRPFIPSPSPSFSPITPPPNVVG